MSNLRDLILQADDLKMEKVHVPQWKLDVYIKQMSGDEQDKFEQNRFNKDGTMNFSNARARMVATALVDENGAKLFNEKDLIELSKKSGAALNFLIDKITELNRITPDEIDALAKN